MAWLLQDPNDRAIIAEIETQSDRAAILVAAALLEERLTKALLLRFDPNASKELLDQVLNGGQGPLGTFSAKIDMGALMQLYPERVRKLFRQVKSIRNDAAHLTDKISFDLPSIRGRCMNMQLMEVHWAMSGHLMGLVRAFRRIPETPAPSALYPDGIVREGVSMNLGPFGPRETFLTAVKVLLLALHDASVHFEHARIFVKPPH